MARIRGCRGAGERQRDIDDEPARAGVPRGDLSAVQPDRSLADREPDAGAAGLARARLVDAIERLEKKPQRAPGGAGPVVADLERPRAPGRAGEPGLDPGSARA